MYNALIFEGGGVLGISYLGIIKYLNEKDMLKNIKKFGGSSVGSHVALLLALNYKYEELVTIMKDLPIDEFKDGNFGFIRNLYRFFVNYGYYKGDYINNYYEALVEKKLNKKNATFLDLYNYNQNILKITGTCLDDNCLEIFDYINTPYMPLSKAVQISSTIPLIFKPIFYNNKNYIDGGCLNNLPFNIFDSDSEIDNCLAFDLTNNHSKNTKINNLKEYILAIINTIHLKANKNKVYKDNIKIIEINTENFYSLNFNLSENEKNKLIEIGYNNIKNKL